MSHTNSTTNYSLPQFVGTDKPAWLTDINGAFSGIDTAIKNASDAATTAGTNATTANTSIGTLSNLNTTEKTNLVGAVNEVNTSVGTAQNTANEAYTKGDNAYTKVTALEQALNLSTVNDCTLTKSSGITSFGAVQYAKCATNADKSLFKIYGVIDVNLPSNTSNQSVTISNTGIGSIDTAYTVNAGVYGYKRGDTSVSIYDFTVNTDGTITIPVNTTGSTANSIRLWLPPILYFNKSFGDTPTPE